MVRSGISASKLSIESSSSMDKPEAENADTVVASKPTNKSRLEETLAQIKNRENERKQNQKQQQNDDYAKLEALKLSLYKVIAQIPEDNKSFTFQVLRSADPRLQIDASAFVTLRPGGEGYLLYLDTPNERKILAEAGDRDGISATIVRYVASRLANKNRSVRKPENAPAPKSTPLSPALAAQLDKIASDTRNQQDFIDTASLLERREERSALQSKYFGEKPLAKQVEINQALLNTSAQDLAKRKSGRAMRSFLYFILGILVGAGGLLAVAWFRLELGL